MRFKPLRYNTGEGRVSIRIEDDTGKNIENWKIMMSDIGTWYHAMLEKYGDRINNKKKDQDLDWLR